MQVERIRAALPARDWPGGRDKPQPGEALRLKFGGTDADDLVATTPAGATLRLTGLAHLGRGLAPGDVFLARVVSTSPELELELSSPRGGAGERGSDEPDADPAALRLDQAALRRVVLRLPEPPALAAAWQQALLSATSGRPAPAHTPGAALPLLAAPEEAARQTAQAPERWMLPVLVWGGMPAALQPVTSEEETTPPRRRSASRALRLELDLPGVGRVGIEVRQQGRGIALVVHVGGVEAAALVREAMPAIAAALSRAELALVKAAVEHRPPAGGAAATGTPPVPSHYPAWLHAGLFRAAAEVTVVLLAQALAATPR